MSQPNGPKYYVFCSDFKEHQDAGPWRSYDLESEGNSLDELLENAVYWQVDQDGGSLGDTPADDADAVSYIETWFAEQADQ